MTFSERLIRLMEDNLISKYQLARKLDCHPSTITNWINGTRPQQSKLKQVADLFGVSVEYLKGETDDPGEIKDPPPIRDGLSVEQHELIDLTFQMTPEEASILLATARATIAARKFRDNQ